MEMHVNIMLTQNELEHLYMVLIYTQDERPEGSGWKSKQLQSVIDKLEDKIKL